MSRIFVCLYSLSLLILFSQCGSTELKSAPGDLYLGSSWLHRGDSLPLDPLISEIPHSGEDELILLTADGLLIAEKKVSGGTAGSLPIPEGTGNGILELSLSGGEGAGRSIPFYYLEKAYGAIDLTSYPPLPMAGSIVEVRCRVESPGENPYIRWSLEGKIMGEGFFSDGLDRFCFFSPRKKGNYTVSAEIFPGKPVREEDRSPWEGEVEIFLNETADVEGTLDPAEWENLFLCDGSHIDRGMNGNRTESAWAMNSFDAKGLAPVILEGDRGYGFTSESTLRYDGKMLQGNNSPLSRISARLQLVKPEKSGKEDAAQIFNTRDGRGDFGFTLFLRENQLQLSWQLASDRFLRSYLPLDDSLYGRPFWLTVEVEQREDTLLIRWYLDGILIREEPFLGPFLPPFFEAGGQTVWGKGDTGYPSFEGFLYEWGFTSNPSSRVFGGDQGQE